MKINFTLAESDEPVESNPILSEARARIIWGESAASVHGYLITNGIAREMAGLKIREFLAERNRVIRRNAIKKIVLGGGLFAAAVLFVLHAATNRNFSWSERTAKGVAVICLVGIYGFCKLINGIIYLVRPQCETESITEISD